MLLNKTHEDTKKEFAETRKKNNTNEHHITTQPTIPKYTDEKQPCIQDKSTSRTLNKKISVEDIKQFSFTNYKIDELIYDDDMAIMMISTANRNQVKKDIQTVNTIVKDVYKLTKIPNSLYIEPDELKFNTTKMSGTDKKEYYTFFECTPYTKTGKKAKYPLVFHYATKAFHLFQPDKDLFGKLYYSQNGSMGKGELIYWINHTGYFIYLGLIDKTLSIKKIEKAGFGKKYFYIKHNYTYFYLYS